MWKERWTRGRDKAPESGDPLELVMEPVPGGSHELMATCLIEEYARLGMDEEEVFELFRRPVYQTHELLRAWGEERIRELIRSVMTRTGRMRISVTLRQPRGDDDA